MPTPSDPAAPSANCRIERLVEWADTDAAGIAHNSAFLRWVEACEAELMRAHGLIRLFPLAPRVQQTISFTAPVHFGQRVLIELAVRKVGRSSLTFEFAVVGAQFEGRAAVAAAHGSVTVVHVPLGTSSSAPWPPDLTGSLSAAHWTTVAREPAISASLPR